MRILKREREREGQGEDIEEGGEGGQKGETSQCHSTMFSMPLSRSIFLSLSLNPLDCVDKSCPSHRKCVSPLPTVLPPGQLLLVYILLFCVFLVLCVCHTNYPCIISMCQCESIPSNYECEYSNYIVRM